MRIILLHCHDALSWGLMPIALRRIAKFCERYGSETSPQWICTAYMKAFVEEKPGTICMVALDEDLVIGHCLATLEPWGDRLYVNVIQFETDRPVDRTLMREAFEILGDWGRKNGADAFQVFARNRDLARVFRTFWGFEEKRILMRLPLAALTSGVKSGPGVGATETTINQAKADA